MIAQTSQFPDHLARPHLLRFFADGWPAFLVLHALVKNLPNEATESVGDRTDGLGVPEARDDTAIHDGEDGRRGLHSGVRGLIQDASDLAGCPSNSGAIIRARWDNGSRMTRGCRGVHDR